MGQEKERGTTTTRTSSPFSTLTRCFQMTVYRLPGLGTSCKKKKSRNIHNKNVGIVWRRANGAFRFKQETEGTRQQGISKLRNSE